MLLKYFLKFPVGIPTWKLTSRAIPNCQRETGVLIIMLRNN